MTTIGQQQKWKKDTQKNVANALGRTHSNDNRKQKMKVCRRDEYRAAGKKLVANMR